MTEIEIAVGLLATWMARPSRLAHGHSDTNQDDTSAVACHAVFELITAKLGQDPALERLSVEATGSSEVRPRTRARLAMALEDAVEDDRDFALQLGKAVKQLRESDQAAPDRGSVTNTITGNVSGRVIQARDIHGGITLDGGTRRK